MKPAVLGAPIGTEGKPAGDGGPHLTGGNVAVVPTSRLARLAFVHSVPVS